MSIILGIDGGGTHTTAVAADASGRVKGFLSGGPMNYNAIGMDVFRKNLSALLREAETRFGRIEAISMGHSALDDEPDQGWIAELLRDVFPAERCLMQSDVFMTLMGTTLGRAGIAVIAGTGSMVLAVDESGRQIPMGGWGYLLQDEGSGFHIGQQGILAAVKADEGVAPATLLTAALMEHFSVSRPRDCIPVLYGEDFSPSRMAAFAPCVFSAAKAGDAAAAAIIEKGAGILADYVVALSGKLSWSAPTVGIFGGLFQHQPLYCDAFSGAVRRVVPRAAISLPRLSPALGALAYYFSKKHTLTAQVTERLLTYQEKELSLET